MNEHLKRLKWINIKIFLNPFQDKNEFVQCYDKFKESSKKYLEYLEKFSEYFEKYLEYSEKKIKMMDED